MMIEATQNDREVRGSVAVDVNLDNGLPMNRIFEPSYAVANNIYVLTPEKKGLISCS